MRQHEVCIMGCPKDEVLTTHCFPANPKRRAEWCRILGIYPKQKRVVICGAHFNDYYKFGNKLSLFAVPNAPDSKRHVLNKNRLEKHSESATNLDTKQEQNLQIPNLPSEFSQTAANDYRIVQTDASIDNLFSPQTLQRNVGIHLNFSSEDNYNSDCNLEEKTYYPFIGNNDAETEGDEDIKTGDFEIRRRDTNELIVQLRSIKTKNSRMLSFILPQKYALQQLIKSRDVECNRQYKEIRKLKIENARLLKQLKIYRFAVLHWRYVKAINRHLNFRFKKIRQRMTRLKKKLKSFKRIRKLWNEFRAEGFPF